MKVTAVCTRSGGWWAIEVPEVPGVFTQARRLSQAPEMVADAVSLMANVDAGDVEVTIQPRMDSSTRVMLDRARVSSAKAKQANEEASLRIREAAAALRDQGLTTRDIAFILGVVHQRVSQLLASAPSNIRKSA